MQIGSENDLIGRSDVFVTSKLAARGGAVGQALQMLIDVKADLKCKGIKTYEAEALALLLCLNYKRPKNLPFVVCISFPLTITSSSTLCSSHTASAYALQTCTLNHLEHQTRKASLSLLTARHLTQGSQISIDDLRTCHAVCCGQTSLIILAISSLMTTHDFPILSLESNSNSSYIQEQFLIDKVCNVIDTCFTVVSQYV